MSRVGSAARTSPIRSSRRHSPPTASQTRSISWSVADARKRSLAREEPDLAPRVEARRRLVVELELALVVRDQRIVSGRDDHHGVATGHRDELLQAHLAERVRLAP